MNQPPIEPEPQREKPRQIAKWAKSYAQNRSLGVVVGLTISGLLFTAIFGASRFGGEAYRSGNMPLFWGCIAVLAVALVALIFFSVPQWGGKFQQRLTQRLYAGEGNVAFLAPGKRKIYWGLALAVVFAMCVVGSVEAGFAFDIPAKFTQPISALFMVPFLVGLWWLMRPTNGYLALLWPALYAMHAILIVAGAPILFTGRWDILNMLLPVAGYGLLTALVRHAYSRIALGRLKTLSQAEATGSGRAEMRGEK